MRELRQWACEKYRLGVPGVAEYMAYEQINSRVMGKIAFWLALSPWFYAAAASLLRLPGFG